MLLMIDNYDSFTYNLVQYFSDLGEEVSVFRNDEVTIKQITALAPERIVISPGPCTPDEAGVSLSVIKYFSKKYPSTGCLFGSSEHRASFWWKDCSCKTAYAWKNIADFS